MPVRPWIMTQTWNHLLFAHWPFDPHELRAAVPAELPLDEYGGQAWLGIIPFHMTNVSPRGVPNLPAVSAFAELNVRTYVTVDGKPGVYFFSLDAGSALAAAAARVLVGLPYFAAAMVVQVREGAEVRYRSSRLPDRGRSADLRAAYRPAGAARPPEPGSLEYFLTERYCLYTVDRRRRTHRLQIHHPRWPLQPAEADIEVNTMAAAAGLDLPAVSPLLHYARRQDMVAWAMETTDTS